MVAAGGEPSMQDAAFAALLVESGLVGRADLEEAAALAGNSDRHVDEILIERGLLDPRALVKVVATAWRLPIVPLSRSRIDRGIFFRWSAELYLAENWMPVHEGREGRVLVATARIPDADRTARIAAILASQVEFGVATSSEIRAAVLRTTNERRTRRRPFGFGGRGR